MPQPLASRRKPPRVVPVEQAPVAPQQEQQSQSNAVQLLRMDEAAAQLRMSRRMLEKLIYRSEVPSVKIGRQRFIWQDALTRYIERLHEEQGFGDYAHAS